jgi:hypothetical protein
MGSALFFVFVRDSPVISRRPLRSSPRKRYQSESSGTRRILSKEQRLVRALPKAKASDYCSRYSRFSHPNLSRRTENVFHKMTNWIVSPEKFSFSKYSKRNKHETK